MVSSELANKYAKAALVTALIYGVLSIGVGAMKYFDAHQIGDAMPQLPIGVAFIVLGFGAFRKIKIACVGLLVFYSVCAFYSSEFQRQVGNHVPSPLIYVALGIPFILGAFAGFGRKSSG